MASIVEAFRSPSSLTVSELVTVTAPLSIAAAAIYNLGFFFPSNVEFVALLSVQDLLWGAAVALLPIGTALYMGSSIANATRVISSIPKWNIVLPIFIACLVIITIVLFVFVETLYYPITGIFSLATIIAGIVYLEKLGRLKYFELYIIAVLSFYACFSTGYSSFYTNFQNPKPGQYEIDTKYGGKFSAQILRITSGYIFAKLGNKIAVLPLGEVHQVTQIQDAANG